mgnify:CR=1 FL=1
MQTHLRNKINKLSVSEKILLVEELWDDIARKNETFELSQSQKSELEKRSLYFEKNPEGGKLWEEIKDEFLKGKKL